MGDLLAVHLFDSMIRKSSRSNRARRVSRAAGLCWAAVLIN